MDTNDLLNRFTFHPATPESGPRHDSVRQVVLGIALGLDELLPEGREKSLAITKLEEVMFWANAAIARA